MLTQIHIVHAETTANAAVRKNSKKIFIWHLLFFPTIKERIKSIKWFFYILAAVGIRKTAKVKENFVMNVVQCLYSSVNSVSCLWLRKKSEQHTV